MELIIAVLVYLGAFVEGNNYSPAEIDAKVSETQPQVQEVLQDEEQVQSAIEAFENSNWDYNPETGLVMPWKLEDEEIIIIAR